MSEPEPLSLERLVAALSHSHDRLAAAVSSLSSEQLRGRSYCTDWSIAQVASHLGSGAEIFGLLVDAGLGGGPAPAGEQFQPVWERWNARDPDDQVRDALGADVAFVERLEGLSEDQRRQWRLHVFGSERRLVDLVRMRLNEHAVHSWDIVVSFDPQAGVLSDAVELIVESLGEIVGYLGKPIAEELGIQVTTTAPERHFLLALSPQGARLDSGAAVGSGASGQLRLPAEAFVRLVYGRLDPDHTPSTVTVEGVDLDSVRRAFVGV